MLILRLDLEGSSKLLADCAEPWLGFKGFTSGVVGDLRFRVLGS